MIPEISPYNNYIGDGATNQFDFDFYIENSSQLRVEHINADGIATVLEENIDYTINEIGNNNGSYIIFPKAGSSYSILTADEVISLQLTLPISQESEYGKSSELDFKSLEYSLDYLTRLIQIINRQQERAVKVQEGSLTTPDELIETLTQDAVTASEAAIAAANAKDSIFENQNFQAVAGDLQSTPSNIATVASDLNGNNNISIVANSIVDVIAAGVNIEDVKTIADNISDVNTVADNLSGNDTIGIVAGIDNEVVAVANIAFDVQNVSAIKDDVTSLNHIKDDVTAVSGIKEDVTAVANIAADVSAVEDIKEDVTAVANIAADVTTAANNIVAIQEAPTHAANAKIASEGTDAQAATIGLTHSAKGWAEVSAQGQIQPDWLQNDATQKDYIKHKPVLKDFDLTLGTTWQGTEAPYSQSVNVADILETDTPIIGLVKSSTWASCVQEMEEYSKIKKAETGTGVITFYAEEKTEISLNLKGKIIR